jgi:hypothetical protein
MRCTGKEWDHCRVEKMGCKGCYYDERIDNVIKGLEDLIDDRLSFLGPDDIDDEDNVFVKDIKVLKEAIKIIKELEGKDNV